MQQTRAGARAAATVVRRPTLTPPRAGRLPRGRPAGGRGRSSASASAASSDPPLRTGWPPRPRAPRGAVARTSASARPLHGLHNSKVVGAGKGTCRQSATAPVGGGLRARASGQEGDDFGVAVSAARAIPSPRSRPSATRPSSPICRRQPAARRGHHVADGACRRRTPNFKWVPPSTGRRERLRCPRRQPGSVAERVAPPRKPFTASRYRSSSMACGAAWQAGRSSGGRMTGEHLAGPTTRHAGRRAAPSRRPRSARWRRAVLAGMPTVDASWSRRDRQYGRQTRKAGCASLRLRRIMSLSLAELSDALSPPKPLVK